MLPFSAKFVFNINFLRDFRWKTIFVITVDKVERTEFDGGFNLVDKIEKDSVYVLNSVFGRFEI